jgi:hypothetical protein
MLPRRHPKSHLREGDRLSNHRTCPSETFLWKAKRKPKLKREDLIANGLMKETVCYPRLQWMINFFKNYAVPGRRLSLSNSWERT